MSPISFEWAGIHFSPLEEVVGILFIFIFGGLSKLRKVSAPYSCSVTSLKGKSQEALSLTASLPPLYPQSRSMAPTRTCLAPHPKPLWVSMITGRCGVTGRGWVSRALLRCAAAAWSCGLGPQEAEHLNSLEQRLGLNLWLQH